MKFIVRKLITRETPDGVRCFAETIYGPSDIESCARYLDEYVHETAPVVPKTVGSRSGYIWPVPQTDAQYQCEGSATFDPAPSAEPAPRSP